jgi:hypothetical protein
MHNNIDMKKISISLFVSFHTLISLFVQNQPHVLVFSKTASLLHNSIEVGKATLQKMGIEKGFIA